MKLPITDEDLQRLLDDANPLTIPAMVDAIGRCQGILKAIQEAAQASDRRKPEDMLYFHRYASNIIHQIIPQGGS